MPVRRRHCSWKEFIGQVLDKYDEYQSRPEVTISAERHLLTCHWGGDYVSLKLIVIDEPVMLSSADVESSYQDICFKIANKSIASTLKNLI